MFHINSLHGRIFSGTLEELRKQGTVLGVARVGRMAASVTAHQPAPEPSPASDGSNQRRHSGAHAAAAAYEHIQTVHVRQPLTCAADVMHSPVITVPVSLTLRQAWQVMAQHRIGQAPVVNESGALVGLLGRAELMPSASLEPPDAAAEWARLSQPVTSVMWSPVPSAAPGTDLRRLAALLLATGLPGVPVADDAGQVLGFVSRTDLLRALSTEPPLDLWS